MRTIAYAIAAALLIAVGACTSHAADLGKPAAAPPATLAEAIPDQWRNCNLETGAGQRRANGEHITVASVGVGCNFKANENPFMTGVFARYGMRLDTKGDSALVTFDQPITVGLRAGYMVMSNTQIYAMGGYMWNPKVDQDRGFTVGLGLEQIIWKNLRIAPEYSLQFADNGDTKVHNFGLYLRAPF